MPFLRSDQGQNSGFQRGWNMIMSLYGQKQIQERTEAQKKQFDEQMGMQQKRFKLTEDNYKIQSALDKKDRDYDEKFKAEVGALDANDPEYGKKVQNTIIKFYPAKSGPIVAAQMKAKEAAAAAAGKETKAETRDAQKDITQENQENASRLARQNQENAARIQQATGMSLTQIIRRANAGDPIAQGVLAARKKYDEDVARIRATVTTPKDKRIKKAQAQATAELGHLDENGSPLVDKDIAKLATGPYSNLKAFIDAFAGGVGIDKLIGKDGLFKDIQKARQTMLNFKNSVLDALKFSRMGASYDIKRITDQVPDPKTIFTNPTTAANKLDTLRSFLKVVKRSNLEGITQAVSDTEIDKLMNANHKINTILSQIGESNQTPDLSPQAQDWLKKKGY